MNYAVILAGGTGSRFWPLSRQLEPKQFLSICSNKPMLKECFDRLSRVIKKECLYLATNRIYKSKVYSCLKGKSGQRILFEPEGKNTLAPIAALSALISAKDKDAVIAVIPCDHFVRDEDKFLNLIKKGIAIARDAHIVCLGFRPWRPETGYGYIKTGRGYRLDGAGRFYEAAKFIEKPGYRLAKKLIRNKKYYWNGGIFIFKASLMLDEIKRIMPEVFGLLSGIKTMDGAKRIWGRLPAVSIDYGIMEKSKETVLLSADYPWVDLGSWQAVAEIYPKSKSGNILHGNCIDIGSSKTLVWSTDRLVASIGLKDIVIVDTKDALLVCAKDKAQDVKKMVNALREKGLKAQI